MLTIILLFGLAIVFGGALMLYKFMGKKDQVAERKGEAASRGATTGRATGSGND